MSETKKAAVFLDRDGTLILDKDYLCRPEEVEFIPGAMEALRRLQGAGYLLVLVTNQSGVGRGYFSMEDVVAVHDHMEELLRRGGVVLGGIYVAPEAPDQPSRGRKPSPEFLWDARDKHHLDLEASYMVGDKRSDLECGWNAGVKASILVRTGYGTATEGRLAELEKRPVVVNDIAAAADWILNTAPAT